MPRRISISALSSLSLSSAPPSSSHASLPGNDPELGTLTIPSPGLLLLPGVTNEAARMARVVLQENHANFHAFRDDKGGHNSLAEHVLAGLSLGAGADHLKDIFDLQALGQRPMLPLLNVQFTEKTWTEGLGDESFYPDYLVFFNRQIEQYGVKQVLEKYLFGTEKGDLLVRSVSGALHPLIHIGYGVEFGLDAIVAEGLAQASVHPTSVSALFPPPFPPPRPSAILRSFSTKALSSLSSTPSPLSLDRPSFSSTSSRLSSLRLSGLSVSAGVGLSSTSVHNAREGGRVTKSTGGLGALTIVDRMLGDERLKAGEANEWDSWPRLDTAVERRGQVIKEWAEEWIIQEDGGWTEVVEKTEELFWLTTLLLGSTSRPSQPLRLDLFLSILLQSTLSLPPLLEILDPSSRVTLLQTHFRVLLAYWVSRGRPALHLRDTLLKTSSRPAPPAGAKGQEGEGGGIAKTLFERQKEKKREWEEKERLEKEAAAAKEEEEAKKAEAKAAEEEEARKKKAEEAAAAAVPSTEEGAAAGVEGEEKALPVPAKDDKPLPQEKELPPPVVPQRPPVTVEEPTLSKADTANPWTAIVKSAVDHPDERLVGAVRALVYADSLWGTTPPGIWKTTLKDSEYLDGSIFVRVAGQIMDTIGWVREGDDRGDWDLSVLGFDEAWEDSDDEDEDGRTEPASVPAAVEEQEAEFVDAPEAGADGTDGRSVVEKLEEEAERSLSGDKGKGKAE